MQQVNVWLMKFSCFFVGEHLRMKPKAKDEDSESLRSLRCADTVGILVPPVPRHTARNSPVPRHTAGNCRLISRFAPLRSLHSFPQKDRVPEGNFGGLSVGSCHCLVNELEQKIQFIIV